MAEQLLGGQIDGKSSLVARRREPAFVIIRLAISLLALGLLLLIPNASAVTRAAHGVFAAVLLAEILASLVLKPRRHSTSVELSLIVGVSLIQGLLLGVVAFDMVPNVSVLTTANPSPFGWVVLFSVCVLGAPDRLWARAGIVVPATLGYLLGVASAPNGTVATYLVVGFGIAALLTYTISRQLRSVALGEERVEVLDALSGILLQESEEGPQNWAWRTNAKGQLVEVSPGFERATGIPASDWRHLHFGNFLESLNPHASVPLESILEDFAAGRPLKNVELEIDTGQQVLHWRLSGAPITDVFGRTIGYVGANFDVTSSKEIEKEIYNLAHFDPLTGLINRSQFNFQLSHLVSRLERYGSPFALLLLDLDHFKNINDSKGHLVGDQVLTEVARRIRECVRESDLAARLGGDEFAVLLPSAASREDVEPIAERLSQWMQTAFSIEGEDVFLGVSVGIALAPQAGTRPAQLMRNADLALYRAKAAGRGTWKFFVASMDAEARERRLLENELRNAVFSGEIELHFQPLIDSDTGLPTSFEALVRWNHPLRGVVSPSEFIPIAEESGAIVELGDWTIREACRIASTWPEELRVAVNLSPRHFAESDIYAVTQAALEEFGMDAERLELEITEGVLVEAEDEVIDKLTRLKTLGVTIAMDDFGTGYSSLSYLLKFPFDTIKIDKSFVEKVPYDGAAQRILKAIVALGRSLRLSITAEGVETREQAEFLNSIACQKLQGYHFAKPLRASQIPDYLAGAMASFSDLEFVAAESRDRSVG